MHENHREEAWVGLRAHGGAKNACGRWSGFTASCLYNAGIDHRGFINFFNRLQSEHIRTDDKFFSYLSTHPPTSERIAAIQGTRNITPSSPILTAEEWQALKGICK